MQFGIAETDTPLPGDDGVVQEAFERWKACKEWQGIQDEWAREDIKFANGDARNGWQWDSKLYDGRISDELPCLTIPNTRVHNDLVINALSKNRFGIKVRPVGGKASYKSSELMQTLIRRTENISRASAVYRKVSEQQVDGGIGYVILETRYVSERSMDQDIYLKAGRDPTAVYLDPWIKDPDGLDANFGFEFERMPIKEFKRKYPKWADKVGKSPLDTTFADWITAKEIMLCKYYRKNGTIDKLISYVNEAGEEVNKLASEIKKESGPEIYERLIEDIDNGVIDGRTRKVEDNKVEWHLIAGNKVIEKGKWIGKYIPIARCVGRELVINGTLDRKGLTRPQIDPQRMLNFAASTDVQLNALQPKSPWSAPAAATEGQEGWKSANINSFAVLLWNHMDDDGNPIPEPKRIDPPPVNAAYQAAMQNAERWQMMVTGQFQAQLGENDQQSASSGKAIGERQQQGDTATYHFPEHQSDMLRNLGTQLLDIYPKLYDTKRTLHVIGDDGEKSWIQIDPTQPDAVQELKDIKDDEEAASIAFNPNIGEYECVSDPGPDYATQRQEAFAAISMILQQAKELSGVCADLLFKCADFPGAEELTERIQKWIKAMHPYLFDDQAPTPAMAQAQQQIQKLTALATQLQGKLAMKELALKGKDEKRDIESSNAETKRLDVMVKFLAQHLLTPKDQAMLEHEVALKGHDTISQLIIDTNAAAISPKPTANGSAE